MFLDTRIIFNNLSTKARADVKRGHFFIDRGDTAPSVADIIEHEGAKYEVTSVDRADRPNDTRRIHARPVAAREPEPLADWERELLYGTTGPMPTRDIVKASLERGAGKKVLDRIGAGGERYVKSLLGHAIVLAKQEMAEHHKREAAKSADGLTKRVPVELAERSIADLREAVRSAPITIAPKVEENKPARPDAATTLEAASFYIERGEWAGRFERLLRGFRKPMTPQLQLAMGGMVVGGSITGVPGSVIRDAHGFPMGNRIR